MNSRDIISKLKQDGWNSFTFEAVITISNILENQVG